MKQLNTLFAIIVWLIVVYVCVGCSESSHDVQMVQGESSAETKPFAETKIVADKHDATKAEKEMKLNDKSAPTAVPVVTSEEAEKINAKAQEYAQVEKARREPFCQMYENSTIKTVAFEGTVQAVSEIPNPQKNDYDDCLYALCLELESVLTDDNSLSKEIVVNVPIMKDKKIIEGNIFHPGDKVYAVGAEYENMTQEIQQIQLSDDLQFFESQSFYAINICNIPSFSNEGNRNFSSREITILPIQTLPKDVNAAKKRQERIQKEISRIEEELKKHGGSFAEWKKEYKSIEDRYKQLCKDGVKGWIGNSYFAAAGPETSGYRTKDYISSILPYKKYLEEHNIDLIVVRIPSKWDFAARVYGSEDYQDNPAWIENYYECLKNDIEIVDPMYEMWKERFDYPLFYFYQQDSEAHPFEGMYLASAKALAEVLERYDYEKTDKITWEDIFFEKPPKDERDYYPEGNSLFCDENGRQRQVSFKGIKLGGRKVGRLKTYGESPFVFLSNSMFGVTNMQDQGASLPHYCCFYLNHMVDWKYQNGMGNGMLRNLISDRFVLNHRKAVVMIGLWGSIPPIPRYIQEKASRIVQIKEIQYQDLPINKDEIDEQMMDKSVPMIKLKSGTASFDLDIPPMKDYKTCMIRLNVPECVHVVIMEVLDMTNKKVMDESDVTTGNDLKNDLFIPASSASQRITIQIKTGHTEAFTIAIRSVEIWGY